MSDREGSYRSMERDRSPRLRRDDSPRNHKDKSYSRSRSRSRSRGRDRRREDREYSSRRSDSRRRHMGTRDNPKPSRCLGVFGLNIHTTEDELYHIFNKYGPVERVQVVLDAKTGRSRGFAFVYFESSDDAKVAKDQCTGMKINSKSIRVDFSITERAHTPTPGIYMGKPTYKYDRYEGRGRRERDRDDYNRGGSRYRRSPSPYYCSRSRRRYSRSRSYSPRLQTRAFG
ncbi:transformer-2 protein homolog beta-like isoform X6 [Euwallacea fornicatus]|uniref:transformer-2 protein homolog beta-like isoform X6 n=1 Tax=Euwallacea fornicatus TaxID=995702 RepID=UPI00338DD45E